MTELDSYERRVLAVSNHLVDEVLALRMRPFRDGVHMFPRMVRDLARSLGKEAAAAPSRGEDTLVDRDILARIESPLNHMLRNAVDHGMETPAARLAAGKAAAGAIAPGSAPPRRHAGHRHQRRRRAASTWSASATRVVGASWPARRWRRRCRRRSCWSSCSCPPSA